MATKKNNQHYVSEEPKSTTDHLDLSKAIATRFPNLKPSTETISLRMPAHLLDTIKIEANKRNVPYQSLIKLALAEKFESKLQSATR